ncbi:MAG: hypothetical protein HYY93_14580 [Planctomycetes bacterium]|nr:hypothetical protein [Planctomycetota bacterium]
MQGRKGRSMIVGLVAFWGLFGGTVWSQDIVKPGAPAETEALKARVESLEKQIAELKDMVKALRPAAGAEESVVEEGAPADRRIPGPLPERAEKFEQEKSAPGFGGIYTKPFLTKLGRDTYLGGYYDFEFREQGGKNKTFDQHRLIPFIYGDVAENVKFATEIEIEHGGPQNNQDDGELKVEFAQVDLLLHEAVNVRAGVLLTPLGKLNAVHDSPIQDLTDRPLVDRTIIPTTLSEAGAGLFGSLYPGETGKLDYEAYLVNGFKGLDAKGKAFISKTDGLRGAKGSEKSDINNSPALVSRLGYSPFLALEVGGSVHTGLYDEKGDNRLTIWALDAKWQTGPFELEGEYAFADISRNSFAKASGIPGDFWGFYVQANYHFMPEGLKTWGPKVFGDEDATFTAVVRYDQTDLDGGRLRRITPGFNFRPNGKTVIKFDYQFNDEGGDFSEKDDNAFLISIATYF